LCVESRQKETAARWLPIGQREQSAHTVLPSEKTCSVSPRGTIDDQQSREATIDCSRAQRTDGERSEQLDGDESEPENLVMS